jgi:hypothetical protein
MVKASANDARLSRIDDVSFKAIPAFLQSSSARERRDVGTRMALVHRVFDEFDEMPGTSLTLPQAVRLFGLPAEVCDRILVSLVKDGRLRQSDDGRFRLRSFAA